jgi:AAA+ ATPase superfamily predicted ATPase
VKIIGRKLEQQELERVYESEESEFVVVYGRRRVGKTFLVREYFGDRITFSVTGLATDEYEGKPALKAQLLNFDDAMARYFGKGRRRSSSWFEAFNLLRDGLEAMGRKRYGKRIVFIDEMPWMDTQRSGFITALEHFWNGWAVAQPDILLIVCGSAAAWITKKLLKNRKGLHNRVTGYVFLVPFTLRECEDYCRHLKLGYRRKQIIDLYLVFGGVPYYFRMLQKGLSPAQNIDRLCFAKSAPLADEFDALYNSLFKSPQRHIELVRVLSTRQQGLTREEIAAKGSVTLGGSLTDALQELRQCGFIQEYRDFTRREKGRYYKVIDPFSLFYLRFMDGKGNSPGYWSARLDSARRNAWSGLSFELVCLLHVPQIKRGLGISGVATEETAWRSREVEPGAQVDLVIARRDRTINLCEMKCTESPFRIDKDYAERLLNKREAFIAETKTRDDVHLTLVSTTGLKKNTYSDIIQSEVSIDDLFAE